MDDLAQKRFTEARNYYHVARATWYRLSGPIAIVHAALFRHSESPHPKGIWHQMTVKGHQSSSPLSVMSASTEFDSTKWPLGKEIEGAWIEVNETFRRFQAAFDALSPDDRAYLDAQAPDSSES